MQERRFPACEYPGRGDAHQITGAAIASEIGVGADPAHLGEPFGAEPFARHRDKPPFFPDADEIAHPIGMLEERAGFGQTSELEHVGRVGLTQSFDRESRFGRLHMIGNHLHASRGMVHHKQARRRRDLVDLDQPQAFRADI